MGVAKKFWPILVIFLLVAIFAYPYWAKGLVPFNSTYLVTWFAPWNAYFGMPVKNGAMPDIISQIYPWRNLVMESFKMGQWPLWNPYSFAGTPLLANFQSAVFQPFNFLFFLLPSIDAWSLAILLQPLLAMFFTYLFCRQLKINQSGSLLAAMAFGFCGFLVVWLAYGTMGFALLWLPLGLWAIEKSRQRPGWALVLSLALAFSIFSGHFQTSLYVIFASLVYIVFRKAWRLLFFWGLGILLATPQILPAVEFYQQSVRSGIFGKGEIIPWQYLITLLVPDFYGNPVTRNDWFGHYAEWAGFIGVIPLILAIWALVRRLPRVWFFVLLGFFSLALALPTPLLDLLIKLKIPVLSTSAASRIISLFSFSAAILAGFGLDQLISDWRARKEIRKAMIFGGSLGFLFLGVWLALLFFRPLSEQWLLVAKRNFILPTAIIVAFGGIWGLGWVVKPKWQNLLIAGILLITAFDLWRFASKWMPFDPREYIYPRMPVIEFLAGRTNGVDRVFGNFGTESQVIFHIPAVEGYDPLYIKRYGEFISTAGDGQIGPLSRSTVYLNKNGLYTDKILTLLGVKYLLHTLSDGRQIWAYPFWKYPEQYQRVYQDEKHEVWENQKALPRAFLVYDYQVVKEPQTIIDTLLAADFDLAAKIILEEEPAGGLLVERGEKGTASITGYSPNKIEIRVVTSRPALLFLSDNYYPGWQALVDGQKTRIYRANYTFRAVTVPAGEHEIRFVYQPNG